MSKVEAIEHQVQALSVKDLAQFREWFVQFDAHMWDQQLEADVVAGKLDALADKALAAHVAGQSTEL